MTQSMIIWCVIAGALFFAFVFRAVERLYAECRHNEHEPRRFFEIGEERELFYIPGDIEDDDYEDL